MVVACGYQDWFSRLLRFMPLSNSSLVTESLLQRAMVVFSSILPQVRGHCLYLKVHNHDDR
jgi:hypothetical protein